MGRAQPICEVVRRKADAPLQPRQAELAPDAGRQPWIGLRQTRPDAFVEPGQDHEIGLLQPRFEQAEYGNARMAALRRTHGDAVQHLRQHRGETGGIGRRRTVRRGKLQIGESAAAA